MIRRPPRSTQGVSSAASDVYKRQGLDRIYGGFSRADRMVLTLVALVLAAWQAHWGVSGIEMSDLHWLGEWALLGNSELNGMTFALGISAWGGVYTFLVRFVKTRNGLLA